MINKWTSYIEPWECSKTVMRYAHIILLLFYLKLVYDNIDFIAESYLELTHSLENWSKFCSWGVKS